MMQSRLQALSNCRTLKQAVPVAMIQLSMQSMRLPFLEGSALAFIDRQIALLKR